MERRPVIFTTPQFVVFALLFFGAWFALAPERTSGLRKPLLLFASYVFYASWDAVFLLLIIGSTALDYAVGRALGRASGRSPAPDPDVDTSADAAATRRYRRRLLAVSVAGNLGALACFKYFDFFAGSMAALLAALGVAAPMPVLDVVLPVGISFYTFQTMSYTIDVYRGKIEPTDSPIDFALYVAFFPQLVAGPIERARHLLPQIVTLARNRADWSGLGLIALGAFKKAAIADNMADLVALTYTDPGDTLSPAMWIGTYAFAIQIYCDFSGYSDIAVGLGRLMGFDIIQNFRAPYAAAGPSEFWRRWHISLSTWLRDYLYIPLGGNRGTWWKVRRNLMLTMLLGGLWHGAAWNFVLWGGFHGLLLVAARPAAVRQVIDRIDATRARIPASIIRRVVFFHLVCLSWALFRAETLADCGAIFGALLDPAALDWSRFADAIDRSGEGAYLALMGAVMVAVVVVQNLWPVGSDRVIARVWRLPLVARAAFVCALLYAAMLLAPEQPPPFIYFQF